VNQAHQTINTLQAAMLAPGSRQQEEGRMNINLYAILRRDGFTDGRTLQEAAARSTEVRDTMRE
jgi:hypothetical protein